MTKKGAVFELEDKNNLSRQKPSLLPVDSSCKNSAAENNDDSITLELGYQPPYRWEKLLDFFAGRTIPGVEAVREGEYFRTVHIISEARQPVYGWLRVGHRPEKNTLALVLDRALLTLLPEVLSRVSRLFDLASDPGLIFEALSSMNDIQAGFCVRGTRLPGSFDAFEMAVRAVLGQQITVKAARTLAGRFARTYGIPFQSGIEGLTHIFPSPETILALDGSIADHLGKLGIISARANTILGLARAMVEERVDLGPTADPEREVRRLMELPGIGIWTAHYIALRAMGWADAFLYTDYGIKKALAPRSPKEILALGESWRPWRGYATINLWNTL